MPNSTADILRNRGEVIDSAVEAAEGSNQERDSRAAQQRAAAEAAAKEAKRVKEKAGVGRDDSETNKQRLLKEMEARAKAAESQGNKAKAAEIRARMKQLEELT
jgi:gas vesicle protein